MKSYLAFSTTAVGIILLSGLISYRILVLDDTIRYKPFVGIDCGNLTKDAQPQRQVRTQGENNLTTQVSHARILQEKLLQSPNSQQQISQTSIPLEKISQSQTYRTIDPDLQNSTNTPYNITIRNNCLLYNTTYIKRYPKEQVHNFTCEVLASHQVNNYNDTIDICKYPLIPKIVHLIWFYPQGKELPFDKYICVRSILNIIKPEVIKFWNTSPPVGKYWDDILERFAQTSTVLEMLHVDKAPEYIHGKTILHTEHKTDIFRLEKVIEYGGIYVDFDVVALKPVDQLLCYDMVLGEPRPNVLANGIMLAKPNATFLQIWRKTYITFNPNQWGAHSVQMTSALQQLFPELIHVEKDTFVKPNYRNFAELFKIGSNYDWKGKGNYFIHTYFRYYKYEHNATDIKCLDSTLGEIFRYTYYGTSDLLECDERFTEEKLKNIIPRAG